MIKREYLKPLPDEFQINVLGGASEGESIVLHFGNNRWMIVDSCVVGDDVLPLRFLSDIRVSYDSVEYVVCTHWHADHVKGLGKVLDNCEKAKFVIPILSQSEIMPSYFALKIYKKDLSSLDYKTVKDEYCYCMNLAKKRDVISYTIKDTNIFRNQVNGHSVSIDALSPSNEMYTKYQILWSTIDKMRFLESGVDPNKGSMAIAISVDDKLHFLLGADLECNRAKNDASLGDCELKCRIRGRSGWCNLHTDSNIHKSYEEYDYVKIVHHSSKTGYCPDFWEKNVKKDVVGVSTVFSKDNLPQRDMMVYYWDGCKDYYVIAPRLSHKFSQSKTIIEKLQDQGIVSDVIVIPNTYGIVSSKYSMTNLSYLGTEVAGTAYKCGKSHLY